MPSRRTVFTATHLMRRTRTGDETEAETAVLAGANAKNAGKIEH